MPMGEPLRDRFADWRAILAVPALLFAVAAMETTVRDEATEFLLVPPLAVVAYLLFSRPHSSDSSLRAVVLLPLIAAAAGEAGYRLLGLTPWGIAAVLLVVLLAQHALRARMPPALAIAVLAMFLRVHGPWYPVDIVLGTSLVWIAFHAWRFLARR